MTRRIWTVQRASDALPGVSGGVWLVRRSGLLVGEVLIFRDGSMDWSFASWGPFPSARTRTRLLADLRRQAAEHFTGQGVRS